MALAMLLAHSSSLRVSADVEVLSEAVMQSFEVSRPSLEMSKPSESMNSLEPHQANSFAHFSDDADVQKFELATTLWSSNRVTKVLNARLK